MNWYEHSARNNKSYEKNKGELSLEYVYINLFSPRESAILSISLISLSK